MPPSSFGKEKRMKIKQWVRAFIGFYFIYKIRNLVAFGDVPIWGFIETPNLVGFFFLQILLSTVEWYFPFWYTVSFISFLVCCFKFVKPVSQVWYTANLHIENQKKGMQIKNKVRRTFCTQYISLLLKWLFQGIWGESYLVFVKYCQKRKVF